MSEVKSTTYLDSKHTHNNYLRWVKTASHDELMKEYNKISIILAMMRHKGIKSIAPYPDKKIKQDNIRIIKYKHNIVCQEITNRGYNIMKRGYQKHQNRYHTR